MRMDCALDMLHAINWLINFCDLHDQFASRYHQDLFKTPDKSQWLNSSDEIVAVISAARL